MSLPDCQININLLSGSRHKQIPFPPNSSPPHSKLVPPHGPNFIYFFALTPDENQDSSNFYCVSKNQIFIGIVIKKYYVPYFFYFFRIQKNRCNQQQQHRNQIIPPILIIIMQTSSPQYINKQ